MADNSGSTRPAPAGDSGATPTRPGGSGGGLTQVGVTGTGVDGPVAGATLLLALYGALVIVVDLVLGRKLLPHSGLGVAGIILGCLLVGGAVGALAANRADR